MTIRALLTLLLAGWTAAAYAQTPPPELPAFIGNVEVTGSPSRFSGRNAFGIPAGTGRDGGTINGEHIYTFEGSLSGNTATGTFRCEQRTHSAGGAADAIQSASIGSFTVTFQKQ